MVKKYRRGDGMEFHADEGSASDILMSKSGEFTELAEVGGEWVEKELVQAGADVAETRDEPQADDPGTADEPETAVAETIDEAAPAPKPKASRRGTAK